MLALRDLRGLIVIDGRTHRVSRIARIPSDGFRLDEVGVAQLSRRWTRGGFPRSFLARSQVASDERVGFEFKRTSSPTVTPSMRSALADLRLQRL